MSRERKWRAYMALLAVYFFWGTTYLGIRMALEAMPAGLLLGVRFFISGSILLLALRLYGWRLPPGRELALSALFGLLMLGGGTGALVFSEQWVPSGIAALFVSTTPFWMVGIEAAQRNGEKLRRSTILGIAIGFIGILVLVGPAAMGAGLGRDLIKGFLVLQLGCFLWCLGSVLQKKQPTTAHPIMSGALQQLATGLFVLPIMSLAPHHPINWSSRGIWAIGYLVVFGSIVGYSSYIYALEHLPVSLVSTYAYANPIVAVSLGWLFYREPFGWREAIAMTLVITGVIVVKYFDLVRPKAHALSAST